MNAPITPIVRTTAAVIAASIIVCKIKPEDFSSGGLFLEELNDIGNISASVSHFIPFLCSVHEFWCWF